MGWIRDISSRNFFNFNWDPLFQLFALVWFPQMFFFFLQKSLDSESSHAFLLSKTAIQIENACKIESGELNSTE